jgi:hypothetical protein
MGRRKGRRRGRRMGGRMVGRNQETGRHHQEMAHMSAPSQYEPNYDGDQALAELMDEREAYDRSLVKRIAFYDPELAKEVLTEFGLN